ncbi:hypothetical protein B0T10DRAFT_570153 [Thelonectria olida]|uniref:EB domain-containing protein n=1 Tax=Thelonectria olida TaxID=1576542 RepID=A0A9P9ATF6_9HYPO|nr:hypothetical protein B0T10DRAFT_570153 [Thelonectria olida]
MKTALLLLVQVMVWASLGQAGSHSQCRNDNCAQYVTRTDSGISSRRSRCSSILATTVRPAPVYITRIPREKRPANTVTDTTSPPEPSQIDGAILRADDLDNGAWSWDRCPKPRQFSSACRCWAQITAVTTTLPTSAVTLTRTRYLNVGCAPAATGVSGSSHFACSAGSGMCSCLRAGLSGAFGVTGRDAESGNPPVVGLCVRVAASVDETPGWRANVTGPCAAQNECPLDGSCQSGSVCVYDGSCACGTRRCYDLVPGGCENPTLPVDEVKRRKRALEKRARNYL